MEGLATLSYRVLAEDILRGEAAENEVQDRCWPVAHLAKRPSAKLSVMETMTKVKRAKRTLSKRAQEYRW